MLQPTHHIPASAARNPRWSLETRFDTAAIEAYQASRGKRRDSADERQRFAARTSLSSSRTASCESLRSNLTMKDLPRPSATAEHVMPYEEQRSSAKSIRSMKAYDPRSNDCEASSSQPTAFLPQQSWTANTAVPSGQESENASIFTRTPAASLFSRRGSNATSITVPSIAPSTTSNTIIPWVDEHGVCQNPQCQQRTFLQKKAFSLYTRLTHSNRSGLSLSGQQQRASCEHVLLHLQTTQSKGALDFEGCGTSSGGIEQLEPSLVARQ